MYYYYYYFFRLKNDYEKLKSTNNELVQKNVEQETTVHSQQDWMVNEKLRFEGQFNVILSDYFSPTQIKMILNPKKNTSFLHPTTCKPIHVFADIPHMLKLARNHLIDK